MKTDEQRQKEAYNKASNMIANLVTISADIYEEYTKNHNELIRLGEETNFCEEDLDVLAYYEVLDERLGYLIILKALAAQGYVQDNADYYGRWIKR